jgi:hypothetical protein
MDDFSFTDAEVAKLQVFFKSGGKLFVNNGLGLKTFDTAVRRELARVLPDADLARIAPKHDVYQTLHKIHDVRYTTAAAKAYPDLDGKPALEGIERDGSLRVIYSPHDLEGGWLNVKYPLSRGCQPDSARALGMNVIAYFLAN